MKNLTEKIKGLIQKFCTKEVILYAVFGVLTTIINWGTFAILTKAFSNLDKNVANAIAIIADVNGLKSIPKNILEPAYIIKICNSIGVPLIISI